MRASTLQFGLPASFLFWDNTTKNTRNKNQFTNFSSCCLRTVRTGSTWNILGRAVRWSSLLRCPVRRSPAKCGIYYLHSVAGLYCFFVVDLRMHE